MYDVYVNKRNGLLIVARGRSLPSKATGVWRKKRTVRSVSNQISDDVRLVGYHSRNLATNPKARSTIPT